MNIHAIIPSLNRPLQLNLLLESLEKNARGLFDVHICYKATTPDFQSGYNKLITKYKDKQHIHFVKEGSSFQSNIMQMPMFWNKESLVTFLMDDDVLFDGLPDYKTFDKIFQDKEISTLSLRLGANTNIQTYHKDDKIPLPEFHISLVDYNKVLAWYPRYAVGNFAYPYSLDGHIFRLKEIYPLIAKSEWGNPNQLESNLSQLPFENCMASFKTSKLCAIVANSVSGWNSAGFWHPQSAESLNERWLNGQRINLADLELSLRDRCTCTHTEVLFKYI